MIHLFACHYLWFELCISRSSNWIINIFVLKIIVSIMFTKIYDLFIWWFRRINNNNNYIDYWPLFNDIQCVFIHLFMYNLKYALIIRNHVTLVHTVCVTLALHGQVSMLSTVLIWRHIIFCDSQPVFVICKISCTFSWNLNLRVFCARKCIWHPFSCDLGLYGTLPSHIERIASKPISHLNGCHSYTYQIKSHKI